MKYLLILVMITIATQATAQTVTSVSLSAKNNEVRLQFEVSKEVNIKYYLLEGSNDKEEYDVVTRIPSKGNSMLRRKYSVAISETDHNYYRLRQVDMNNACFYTAINNTPAFPAPGKEPIVPEEMMAKTPVRE